MKEKTEYADIDTNTKKPSLSEFTTQDINIESNDSSLETELESVKATLLKTQALMLDLATERDRLNKQLIQLPQDRQELLDTIADSKAELEKVKAENKQTKKEKQTAENQIRELSLDNLTCKKALNAAMETKIDLEKQVNELTAQNTKNAKLETKLGEVTKQVQQLKEQNVALIIEKNELETTLTKKQGEFENMQKEHAQLIEGLKVADKLLKTSTKAKEQVDRRLLEISESRDALTTQLKEVKDSSQKSLADMTTARDVALTERDAERERYSELQQKYKELEALNKSLNVKLGKLQSERALPDEYYERKKEISELQQKINDSNYGESIIQNKESMNKSLEELTQETEELTQLIESGSPRKKLTVQFSSPMKNEQNQSQTESTNEILLGKENSSFDIEKAQNEIDDLQRKIRDLTFDRDRFTAKVKEAPVGSTKKQRLQNIVNEKQAKINEYENQILNIKWTISRKQKSSQNTPVKAEPRNTNISIEELTQSTEELKQLIESSTPKKKQNVRATETKHKLTFKFGSTETTNGQESPKALLRKRM